MAEPDVMPSQVEHQHETPTRLLLSATLTLTLSILGSSVLPVPFAFSRTGVLVGLATSLVVAYANAVGCSLLLRAARKTGHSTFEGVAQAAGGSLLKGITRASLCLLLSGTIVGDFAQLGAVGMRAVIQFCEPEPPPGWLVASDGRVIMVLLTLLVVLPLCCLRRMRSLETVGLGGLGVIAVFAVIIVWKSVAAGLPAIKNHELPLLHLQAAGNLPEAFAVLGFAFYITPVVMPLLAEMPAGSLGQQAISRAVYITVMGIAVAAYGVMGVFAAARYGLKTNGNILVNAWLGGRADGALNAVIAAYLAISIPPMQMSLRFTLTEWVAGENAQPSRPRQLTETCCSVLVLLAVALLFPTASEKIFAVTGATAVCLVVYVVPVVIHLLLHIKHPSSRPEGSGAEEHLLQDGQAAAGGQFGALKQRRWGAELLGWLEDVVIPSAVLIVGVGFSFAALWVAIGQLLTH